MSRFTVEEMQEALDSLRCELEEANESGDLEERLALASRVGRLERLIAREDKRNEQATLA